MLERLRRLFMLGAGAIYVGYGLYRAVRDAKATRRIDQKPRLVWGPIPMINYKYWSNALKEAGYESTTLVTHVYPAFAKEDFDLYIPALVAGSGQRGRLHRMIEKEFEPYLAMIHALRNYDIFHHGYSGSLLGSTRLRSFEAQLIRAAGGFSVVIPYGSDAWMYSAVADPSVRVSLQINYPQAAKVEPDIRRSVEYWNRHADAVLTGNLIDGLGRMDVVAPSILGIDCDAWQAKTGYSSADGRSKPVKVMHAPNHRGVKGTEFIIAAAETLRREGLMIDLILLEGKANVEVRQIMREEADILVEALIFGGYGLNGIEGMASGLPVMSNLDSEYYTQVHRRYSFLEECPIVSATPESVTAVLRRLVTTPALREELGRAGRRYVEKYHSYASARFLFESVYAKIWDKKDVNLVMLFHPISSEYSHRTPKVEPPLIKSRLRDTDA